MGKKIGFSMNFFVCFQKNKTSKGTLGCTKPVPPAISTTSRIHALIYSVYFFLFTFFFWREFYWLLLLSLKLLSKSGPVSV